MKEFRQDAQAVVIGKKIYVIGGRDYKGERVLDSMECFDVSEGEWERVTIVPGFILTVQETKIDRT